MILKTIKRGKLYIEICHYGIRINGKLYIGYSLKEAIREAKQ
jgi:hypothetical protein